jgi:AcrR family transcriptional regulator
MKESEAVKRPSSTRRYRSDVRSAQAAATRLRIIEAAAELFVRDGYGPTSVDDIAARADVGRATLFNAVGGKCALLRAAYDVAVVGDDEPVPLPERSWAQPVRRAKDTRTLLRRYAHMVTVVGQRVADLWEVMRGAASAHADVREHWDEIRKERNGGAANVVTMLLERGRLRRGLDAKRAADIVLVLIDPDLYHQFVRLQGWTSEAFEAWLAAAFLAQLLPD